MYPRSSRKKKSAIFSTFQRRIPRSTLKNQKIPHKLRHLLEHLDVEANAGLSRMGFWYRTIIQSNNDKRPSIIYFVEVVGVDAVVVGVAASPDIVKEASNSSNRRAMSSTVAVQKQGHQLEYC